MKASQPFQGEYLSLREGVRGLFDGLKGSMRMTFIQGYFGCIFSDV